MKSFDESATCPKCGHTEVAISYHRKFGSSCGWGECEDAGYYSLDRQEHLSRYCRRCFYRWSEAVPNTQV